MKLIKWIVPVLTAMLVCACEKEMPSEAKDETGEEVQSISMLSFASLEEMEMQIEKLASMSEEEQNSWYAEHDFESQYNALYRAAAEIDNATTLEEAEASKAKFSSYFLYNENPADEELFNPYLPNENVDYALVCNIEGEVMIGGTIRNFNTITNVENTKEYQRFHEAETRDLETKTNYLKSTVGDRKFWAEGRLDSNEVVAIEFTAHKKGIFGWNKYKTAYFVRVQRHNGNWESFSPDFLYYLNSGENGLWTVDLKSHTLVPVGRLAQHKNATMDLYIYSRGTGEAGAGVLQLDYTSTR